MALVVGGTTVTSTQTLDATKLTGTLPALNASNLTNLDAADLSGTLPAINGSNLTNLPGGGKVLQAVSSTSTGSSGGNYGDNNWANLGPSVSITVAHASNKVLVMATLNSLGAQENFVNYSIYRDSTNLGSTHGLATARADTGKSNAGMCYLDTPGSGAHTYRTKGRADHGAVYIGRNRSGAKHSIVCLELDYS